MSLSEKRPPPIRVTVGAVSYPGPWVNFLAMPLAARETICRLTQTTRRTTTPPLWLDVDRVPSSLNNQYISARRKKGSPYDLHPEVKALRDEVFYRLGSARKTWRPEGLMAAVIVFHTPGWLTKEQRVRVHDADNKVKPLLDAFQKATGICDSRFWELYVFKSVSDRERTTLVVFDLGTTVDTTLFSGVF